MIWGTSSQRGPQSCDLGRMSALDAGYDVRSSGVTLDRFCGSGITAVNLAAATIMAGMADLVVAGGTEMMSMPNRRDAGDGPPLFDTGNLHLREMHPQTNQGVCADAIATLEGITREDVDKLALESQRRAAVAIAAGHFDRSLIPVHQRRRHGGARPRGVSAAEHDAGRPGVAEALVRGPGRRGAQRGRPDLPLADPGQVSGPEDQPHPPRRQFLGRGRRFGGAAARLARLRQGARPEAPRAGGGDRQPGRLARP